MALKCYIHIFLTAQRIPAPYAAAQHQGTIPVGDRPRHPRPPADLTVQSLDHFAGTDAHPILAGKVAVDHCLFNASFNPLRRFLQLHLPQLIDNNFHLLAEGFIALLYMNRLNCMYCNVIQRSLIIFYILLASLHGIFESFEPKHIVTVSICE